MNPKLLVVDDEPEILRIVERVFCKGYEVTAVGTSSEAIPRTYRTHHRIHLCIG